VQSAWKNAEIFYVIIDVTCRNACACVQVYVRFGLLVILQKIRTRDLKVPEVPHDAWITLIRTLYHSLDSICLRSYHNTEMSSACPH
jgi:hypothetical protein